MTPKEKAKNLVDRFDYEVVNLDGIISHTKEESKQCALICVDEMINYLKPLAYDVQSIHTSYWQEVKQEINKL